MKIKLIALFPFVLAAIYPFLVFEVSQIHIFNHDLFDYSWPVFFITIASAIMSLFIVRGKIILFPIFAIVFIIPIAYFGIMLSMST